MIETVALQSRVDHVTPGAMIGARLLAEMAVRRWGISSRILGEEGPAYPQVWQDDLEQSCTDLLLLRDALEVILERGNTPLLFSGKCAASIATLPVLAQRVPNLKVLWFDAHGDFNTPQTSTTAFLGGMVLTAPLGLWDSGFGHGLRAEQLVLAGTRDLDEAELDLIQAHTLSVVVPGENFKDRVLDQLGDAMVYAHLDLDVLEPGTIRAPYSVPGGITLEAVSDVLGVLYQQGRLLGLEVTEFEASGDTLDQAEVLQVIEMLEHVFDMTKSPESK